ncbi:MAG TPA: hypothetical protein GXZ22_06060 [Clostridiaceae bacterium]|nr:hypothetical protein [Clostridiaceae bacterium]
MKRRYLVFLQIAVLLLASFFSGCIIKDNIKPSSGNEPPYNETMDKIEDMTEASKNSGSAGTEASKNSGSAGEGTDSDNMGDYGDLDEIAGQTETNLEMPDSFPTDDVPVMPNANIIDFYENGNKTNVAIIFGTDKSFDEALDFYQENFFNKLENEPIKRETDGSIMFICEMEGYRNIAIVIMEDQSQTYGSKVALEVLK